MSESPGLQRGIPPKKCRFCDRRFSKAEHLKRHQRSHTGERPYTCPRCNKSYSRSDVLIRHMKNHPRKAGEEIEKSSSEGDYVDINGVPRFDAAEQALYSPGQRNTRDTNEELGFASLIDPALESPLANVGNAQSASLGNFRHATMVSQRWANGDGLVMPQPDASMGNHHPGLDVHQNWNVDLQGSPHDRTHDALFDIPQASIGTLFHGSSDTPGITSPFNFRNLLHDGRSNGTQNEISLGIDETGPAIPQDLQSWLDHFDLEAHFQANDMYATQNPEGVNSRASKRRRESSPTPADRDSPKDPNTPASLIPTERFAKVQRCWPNRQCSTLRLMPTLWSDVAKKLEDNLFSNYNLSPEEKLLSKQCKSRWGLDEECREQLQRMFMVAGSASDRFAPSPNHLSVSDRSSSHAGASSNQDPPITSFPPAGIFDIGLDLYFRQFHSLIPFIHVPTFCPKTAPTSLLFVMCLIGLTILQTKGAAVFVKQTFSKALEQISSELVPPSSRESSRIAQLSSLASAVLLLYLSEMTGEREHQTKCLMLYANIISIAESNGLFSAKDGEVLNSDIFGGTDDLNERWKSWARVESAKRVILSLTMIDSFYAATLHTSPKMRIDEVQLILPCSNALFQASTATKWSQLISIDNPIIMPTVTMTSHTFTLPPLPSDADALPIQNILILAHMLSCHHFHHLISGSPASPTYDHIPANLYKISPSPSTSLLPTLPHLLLTTYPTHLSPSHPNTLIMWHFICLSLLLDLRIFEQAAGCEGASSARKALDDIAIWTKTKAARRACIHAAQIFRLVGERRVSDGDPGYACGGLFVAALVLGLYVFVVEPTPGQPPNEKLSEWFDLTDDIDWTAVGMEGISSVHSAELESEENGNAAIGFIRSGGEICFDGTVHEPGYEAARRILLDYARLLEDIGRWRVRIDMFSRVLRIMSDALVDVDIGV